jgi:spore maturation protein CgeB
LRIAYIGEDAGNSRLMRLAFERLGHSVAQVDPYKVLSSPMLRRWSFHTGSLFLAGPVEHHIRANLPPGPYDVAFVDSGELISSPTAAWLNSVASRTILFCRDNPFVARDGLRWRLLKPALRHYDLFVTRRESSVAPATRLGARRVEIIIPPADELAHHPLELTDEDRAKYASEVGFIGTWMPERGPFIETLLRRGVPLRVFGPRWERAKNYEAIRSAVTLGGLSTKEFVKAVSASKIALSLLSKGNVDLHTARSVEIPAMGRLLCTERTSDHLRMFREGEEAVFWADADECADVCLDLLADRERLDRIAAAGRARLIQDGRYNEPTWSAILDKATALPR